MIEEKRREGMQVESLELGSYMHLNWREEKKEVRNRTRSAPSNKKIEKRKEKAKVSLRFRNEIAQNLLPPGRPFYKPKTVRESARFLFRFRSL